MTFQEEIDKVIQSSVQSMEDKNLKYERFYIVFIWSIVAGFTALYISLVFNHNIWTDEAFTLQLLQGNVKDIIMGTAKDVHPPLYYLYAKLFMVIFGDSLLVQKVAAIIPMTATLAIGATLIRKNFGNRVSLLFLLFLACIPCTMEFSVQVRMYSMALFFVTLCGIYAYQAFVSGDRKDFLIFALRGYGSIYSLFCVCICYYNSGLAVYGNFALGEKADCYVDDVGNRYDSRLFTVDTLFLQAGCQCRAGILDSGNYGADNLGVFSVDI